MYYKFIMKSLENNENCKKEDIFENDNYLTIESYLLLSYGCVFFQEKNSHYVSFFFLFNVTRSLKILYK